MPFVPDQAAQERAHARWLRKERARAIWCRIACGLTFYAQRVSPAGFFPCFYSREGRVVFLEFVILLVCNVVAATSAKAAPIAVAVAILVGLDILLVNTTIAFVTGRPALVIHPLRSAIFTVCGYFNLALAFGTWWITLGYDDRAPDRILTAAYQSLRTQATLGPDGSVESWWGRGLVMIQVIIGIYFVVMILAIYASWAEQVDQDPA
jgi:hypothetical protein